jgi:hypothetical protein
MRLTVRRVLETLAMCSDRKRLRSQCPELEEEDMRQALSYAATDLDGKILGRFAKSLLAMSVVFVTFSLIGCDRSSDRPAPFDNVQVLRAIVFDECKIAARFGSIAVCESLVSQPLDPLGSKGWIATSSFDSNVKILCINTEAYKDVGDEGANRWRGWIARLERHGNSIDFSEWSQWVPSSLGTPTIWIYLSPAQVGHYFVTSDGKGVCTIVSTKKGVGIEVILEGVESNEHGSAAEMAFRSIQISEAEN